MFVSKDTVPVVFYDGEQETSLGNVVVSDSLNFKNFQSMMSEKIGISPHQFSIYLSDRTRGGSRVPVTARFNFAAVSGHRDCVFLVVLKRSRRERKRKSGGGITDSGFSRVDPPGNVMLLRRGSNQWVGLNGVEMGQAEYERRLMELNAEKQRYLINMGFGSGLDFGGSDYAAEGEAGINGGGAVCEECLKANESGSDGGFHWCVRDTVTIGFRSRAGPIARPAKNTS